MESQKRHIRTENQYSKISLKRRQRLVHMVLQQGLLISKSGKRLGIKLSTAKLIVKRYKETGTYFESKEEKARRLLEEEKKKTAQPIKEEAPSVITQQFPQNFTIPSFPQSVMAVWWIQPPYPEQPLYNYPFYSNWI